MRRTRREGNITTENKERRLRNYREQGEKITQLQRTRREGNITTENKERR